MLLTISKLRAAQAVVVSAASASTGLAATTWPVDDDLITKLMFCAAIAAVAAFLGQLRRIAIGLPGWRVFVSAIISGAMAGVIVSSFALSAGASIEQLVGVSMLVGAMGSVGMDIILDRGKGVIKMPGDKDK